MGFWEDVNDRVDSAVGTNLSGNNSGGWVATIARGDVGKLFSENIKSVGTLFYGVGSGTADLLTGKYDSAGNKYQRAGGAILRMGGGVSSAVVEGDGAQSTLNSKDANKYSFGYLADYAGTVKGAQTLDQDGYLSNENRDHMIGFGVKSGVAVGAYNFYSEYEAASAVGGSEIPGYMEAATTYGGYARDGALAYGAAGALVKGDVKGAAQQIGQISGDYDWLPQFPNLPDWVPDLSGVWDELMGSAPKPGVQESNPWSYGGNADSGISAPKAAGISIVTIALVVGAIYLIKKKG